MFFLDHLLLSLYGVDAPAHILWLW